MKKPFIFVVCIVAALIAGFLISGIIYYATGFFIFDDTRARINISSKASNEELTELAYEALGILKDNDYRALSQIIHPEYGVVFSPYATVTLPTNKCFLPEQVALFGVDTKRYVWGVYVGSGEPIEMTVSEYFSEFVFDRDYTTASVIGVNTVVRSGNALENITEISADLRYVDFHIPVSDKDNTESNDWSSLRLGFEEYNGRLWLTVILHSEGKV